MLKKIVNFTATILCFISLFIAETYAQIVPESSIIKRPLLDYKGVSNTSLAVRSQSDAFEDNTLPNTSAHNRYRGDHAVNNNTKLYLTRDYNTFSGLTYGVKTRLESQFSSDQNRARLDVDQAFFFTKSDIGEFQIGNVTAVNQKMKVGPSSFAKGNGGINGNYLQYVNFPTLTNGATGSNIKLPNFILLAQSPIGHGGYAQGAYNGNFNRDRLRILRDKSFNGAEDALKINYYSPRINGVKVGASYTYDTSESGASTTIFGNQSTTVKDVISLGANYSDSIDNVGYALSLTAEHGSVKESQLSAVKRNNLSSYDVAATVVYFGFTFGASYGSWGSSLQEKDGQGIHSCDYNASLPLSLQDCSTNGKNFGNASYYTLGAAYEIGPFATSITSLKSNFQENEYQAVSLDIDYNLRGGLIPYLEITRYEFESNQVQASDISTNQLQDNKGYVALIGFIYSF